MNYYAHTAKDENGNPLPENSGKWQRLDEHLRNVAESRKGLAGPPGFREEAQIAVLPHDL